jgi:hypothetical protein
MDIVKKYLVALFIVFLHLAAQIKSVADELSRYYFLWHRRMGVALLVAMFLIALGLTLLVLGLEWLARRVRVPFLRRFLGHLFLVALVSGLLASSPTFSQLHHPTLTKLIWLAAMAGIGFSLARPGSRLVHYAFNICLLFSPVAFILSVQVLSWKSWEEPPKTHFTPRKATGPRTPVFVFVFEEWSYQRSTANNELRPFFKNLRRLAEQSIVFPRGRSPSDRTWESLPHLIYQNDLELVPRDGHTYWTGAHEGLRTTDTPSLFQLSRDSGYNCYIVGWALSYNRILGDQVDYCHVYRAHPKGNSVPTEIVHAIYRNTYSFTDPVSKRLRRSFDERRTARHHMWTNATVQKEIIEILTNSPKNTFAIFHMPLAHKPFIWNEDGTYRAPSKETPAAGYERTLRYLDLYVGQILEALKAAGKFDDALIIFTGDHTWRNDPEPAMREGADWKRRVPLVIKLPGQTSGCVIEEKLCTNRLKPLFAAVFAGERDTGRLLQLVRRMAASTSRP